MSLIDVKKRSHKWEKKYRSARGEFPWMLSEIPRELDQLLQTDSIPAGPALDIGCGNGFITGYLSDRFPLAVGFDISVSAVSLACSNADMKGLNPEFLVADAISFPFLEKSFSFIFDRGCLQNLKGAERGLYFREIDRVLKPGGIFQLYCANIKNYPPLLSLAGLKIRVRNALKKKKALMSESRLRRMLPPSMKVMAYDNIIFRRRNGKKKFLAHCVMKKLSA